MQTFRLHGLSTPGQAIRPAPATFGPDSPRRYGRSPGTATSDEPARPAPFDDAGTPQWVDQDFEELVFE